MRYAVSVLMYTLALCGCGSGATGETTSAGNATPGADQKSVKATGLVTADVKNRCAGFGAAQAAEILGVSVGSVTATSQDITPTARGCEFTGGGKKISFSLSIEGSIEDAQRTIENSREAYVISARAQEAATGKENQESAYTDILGVGDEAIWSITNGAMMARHKNLIIMVMAPDDKRMQAAVATKILGLL